MVLSAVLAASAAAQGMGTFSVRVAPAERRSLARSMEFVGELQPWRTIDVASQVAGLVELIPIEEGQALAAGDEICRLDEAQAKIEIERLEAELAASKAELGRLRRGYRSEEIDQARRALEEAEAVARRTAEEWERQRELIESGIVSAIEGTRIRTSHEIAQSARERARSALERLEAGYQVEEVERAGAQAAAQQARLAEARRLLAEHVIRARVGGIIVERLREPGEWVDRGDAVARLLVLDPLRVRVEIPQQHLSRIAPGQRATIRVDGLPDERFEARIDAVIPRAGQASRNFPVLMELANPGGRLISGLFARVMLTVGEPEEATLVPRSAVQIRGESMVVLVARPLGSEHPDQAEIREVEVRLGSEDGELVAIDVIAGEPIEAGEPVVVLGGTRLSNGQQVRVLAESPVGISRLDPPREVEAARP